MTYVQSVDADECWANVRDGALSHLVLVDQLLTEQEAKCGYRPPEDSQWLLTEEGDSPRPASRRCIKCERMTK